MSSILHSRYRSRVVVSVLAILCAAVVLTIVRVPLGYGAFIPTISATKNTVTTRPYFTCNSATQDGTYKSFLTWPLGETAGTTAADASGNGRTGTYATSDVLYNQATPECPRDTTGSVFISGSGGMLASGKIATTPPTALSLEGWFSTGTPYGFLMGFGNSGATSGGTNSTDADRRMYINSSGQLVFGIYNPSVGAPQTIVTPSAVTDNKLHQVVATFSTTTGLRLYLDGSQVAFNTGYTNALTAYSGSSVYLRVGYDNLTGWPGGSTSQSYFRGYLAFASYYGSVLPATLITEHFRAGLT